MERGQGSFDEVKPATPPAYLWERIIGCLNAEKKLVVAKRKAACFFVALAGSIALFLAALFSLWGSIIESDALRVLSVFVSAPAASFVNWQDTGFFFLESLPAAHLAIFLTALLAVLQSLKYVARYVSNTISLSKLLKAAN